MEEEEGHPPPPTADIEHVHQIHCMLRNLIPSGLERSGRIERDLAALRAVHIPAGFYEHQYHDHIVTSTTRKPHVLIAYAWVMYMAIFSGGRHIRNELAGAGDAFWRKEMVKATDAPLGLHYQRMTDGGEKSNLHDAQFGYSFLSFDGEADGEDIKADFKQRLACVEDVLSPEERRDVVAEAQQVFRFSILLVREIDEYVVRTRGLRRAWRLGRGSWAALCCMVGLVAWWFIHWGLSVAIAY